VQLPADDEAVERLLQRAQKRLDGLLGAYPESPPGGLKIPNPTVLTPEQQGALSRACCAVAEHELTVGLPFIVGDEDFVPNGAAIARQPMRTPMRALEELAGSGLRRWSGTVQPDPPPPSPVPSNYPWWW
jgi:hypothetical protein